MTVAQHGHAAGRQLEPLLATQLATQYMTWSAEL
jgi:hypothetical protein